jgi:hypothetical protein
LKGWSRVRLHARAGDHVLLEQRTGLEVYEAALRIIGGPLISMNKGATATVCNTRLQPIFCCSSGPAIERSCREKSDVAIVRALFSRGYDE